MQGLSWQWQDMVFNTVFSFIPCLNFLSPFVSKLILFLPHLQIFVQPHSSFPSSASSSPYEAPFLNHFLSFPLDSSHSQSPPWAFHFKPPFSQCLSWPYSLLSQTISLVFSYHSPSSWILLSPPNHFCLQMIHIIFILPALSFPYSHPQLGCFNAEAAEAENFSPSSSLEHQIPLHWVTFVGWMQGQFDPHRKIFNC